jgi:hypothetical protein
VGVIQIDTFFLKSLEKLKEGKNQVFRIL